MLIAFKNRLPIGVIGHRYPVVMNATRLTFDRRKIIMREKSSIKQVKALSDPINMFRCEIQNHGLQPPDNIQPGKIHRFPGQGKKPGNDAGWCKLFDDMRGGVFGDFSTGLEGHWHSQKEQTYTDEERADFIRRIHAERKERLEEGLLRHKEAAQRASEILEAALDDPRQHPYALKKEVDLGPLVRRGAWPQRDWSDALLIPIYDADGAIWTLGAISPDGEKDYLVPER